MTKQLIPLDKDQTIQLLLRGIEAEGNPQWQDPDGNPCRSPQEILIELLREGAVTAGLSPDGELLFSMTADGERAVNETLHQGNDLGK
jgi:hypothetical protein